MKQKIRNAFSSFFSFIQLVIMFPNFSFSFFSCSFFYPFLLAYFLSCFPFAPLLDGSLDCLPLTMGRYSFKYPFLAAIAPLYLTMEMDWVKMQSSSIIQNNYENCPTCGGTGQIKSLSSLAISLLRIIEEEAMNAEGKQTVYLPVRLATFLLN